MSNMTGGWHPGRSRGEAPQVPRAVGAETRPADTGPPSHGPAEKGPAASCPSLSPPDHCRAEPDRPGRAPPRGGRAGPAAGADVEARLAEAEAQRLRALAAWDNLRRRCPAQVEGAEVDARPEVAGQGLPVVDNLERALEHAAADPRTIVEGIQAVRQQALGVLASLGFSRRDDTGATFDPARHDAVAAPYHPPPPPPPIPHVPRPPHTPP